MNDELYSLYCTFVADAAATTAALLDDAELGAALIRENRPLSRFEFEKALQQMSEGTRVQFVRRIRMGYELAVLTEERGELEKIVEAIDDTHRDAER